MNEEKNADAKVKTGEYHAPWEKGFDKFLTHYLILRIIMNCC